MSDPVVVIAGPTGSGKSAMAMRICDLFPVFEIVSADSVQVYRHFNVGSGKVTEQERRLYPHFCIDIVDPKDDFDVASYLQAASGVIQNIQARGRIPLVVGGTGLYIDSLLFGLSRIPEIPQSTIDKLKMVANDGEDGRKSLRSALVSVDPLASVKIHPNDMQRTIRALAVFEVTGIPISEYWNKNTGGIFCFEPLIVVTDYERSDLYDCINKRVDAMMNSGFAQEVEKLIEMGYSPRMQKTIGYSELLLHFTCGMDLSACVEKIKHATRKYAKRQIVWFSRYNSISYSGDFSGLTDKIKTYIQAFVPDGGIS